MNLPIILNEAELKTTKQRSRLAEFKTTTEKFKFLGGTNCQFSIWAIRLKSGEITIYKTKFDFTGRWVKAKKRPWNQDQKGPKK